MDLVSNLVLLLAPQRLQRQLEDESDALHQKVQVIVASPADSSWCADTPCKTDQDCATRVRELQSKLASKTQEAEHLEQRVVSLSQQVEQYKSDNQGMLQVRRGSRRSHPWTPLLFPRGPPLPLHPRVEAEVWGRAGGICIPLVNLFSL